MKMYRNNEWDIYIQFVDFANSQSKWKLMSFAYTKTNSLARNLMQWEFHFLKNKQLMIHSNKIFLLLITSLLLLYGIIELRTLTQMMFSNPIIWIHFLEWMNEWQMKTAYLWNLFRIGLWGGDPWPSWFHLQTSRLSRPAPRRSCLPCWPGRRWRFRLPAQSSKDLWPCRPCKTDTQAHPRLISKLQKKNILTFVLY